MTIDAMSPEELVKHILGQLGETEDRPRAQMAALVEALGSDRSLALLYETRAVESQGGMLLPDGTRRRTAGGVYFILARARLTKEQRAAIFDPWYTPRKKVARAPAPPAPPKPAPQLPITEVVRRRPPGAAAAPPPEPAKPIEPAPAQPPPRKRVVSPPAPATEPARGRPRGGRPAGSTPDGTAAPKKKT